MATKLIALNSNKFLWQSGGPCDCLTFAAILALDGSAEIGKLGRFKDLSVLKNPPALFLRKQIFSKFSRTNYRDHGLIDGSFCLFVLT
jgi:hypothetical protein